MAGVNLHDLELGSGFLGIMQKSQTQTTTKVGHLDFIKIKTFYSSKDIKKGER